MVGFGPVGTENRNQDGSKSTQEGIEKKGRRTASGLRLPCVRAAAVDADTVVELDPKKNQKEKTKRKPSAEASGKRLISIFPRCFLGSVVNYYELYAVLISTE